MITNAALHKVSGLMVWWYQFKENIKIQFDAKSHHIHFDGNVKDK